MADKKDISRSTNKKKDTYVINPYPRMTEAKQNLNAVEEVLFGGKNHKEEK